MKYTLIAAVVLSALYSPAVAQPRGIKTAYLACRTEATFAKGEEIRRSGDFAALKAFLLMVIPSGACTWLSVGDAVYYEGSGSAASVVKIRPPGQITSFFTRTEILD
jgi:hypothetical protein